jgi:hypothetical protein
MNTNNIDYDKKESDKLNNNMKKESDKLDNNMKKESDKLDNKMKKVIESLTINYKSWIVIFISLFLIPGESSFYNKIITFFFILFLSYYFHYIAHVDTRNSSVHLYHHTHTNLFSHFIQILLEFVSILFIIPLMNLLNIPIFDYWTIILFFFFYTTVHNINYSIFHVNTIHEKHHKDLTTNIGPDICDILFGTKYDDVIENTDHYIINIIIAYLVVYSLHYLWTFSDGLYQIYFVYIFSFIYIVFGIIVLYFTFFCFGFNELIT